MHSPVDDSSDAHERRKFAVVPTSRSRRRHRTKVARNVCLGVFYGTLIGAIALVARFISRDDSQPAGTPTADHAPQLFREPASREDQVELWVRMERHFRPRWPVTILNFRGAFSALHQRRIVHVLIDPAMDRHRVEQTVQLMWSDLASQIEGYAVPHTNRAIQIWVDDDVRDYGHGLQVCKVNVFALDGSKLPPVPPIEWRSELLSDVRNRHHLKHRVVTIADRIKYVEGLQSDGTWKNHGFSFSGLSDGSIVRGSWWEGRMDGTWLAEHPDGHVLVQEWRDDRLEFSHRFSLPAENDL